MCRLDSPECASKTLGLSAEYLYGWCARLFRTLQNELLQNGFLALSGDASGPISIAGVVAASTGAAIIVVAAIVVVVGF